MRRILLKSIRICLVVVLLAGAYVAWRVGTVAHTGYAGFKHIRYLLETGEAVEGMAADEALSDAHLLSLFGGNPELVENLKNVVDLGMATDPNLKTGDVMAMIVTYQKDKDGKVRDAAVYALGGFPDPQSKRLGFHIGGFFAQEMDRSLWEAGNMLVNLIGRDIVVFCSEESAERHMSLLFDLLNGNIYSLAHRIIEAPVYFNIVFPDPKRLAPPNIKNQLQTVTIEGVFEPDSGKIGLVVATPSGRAASHVHTVLSDMLVMLRVTFHDKFGGYIKEMSWGKMNDNWWAVEYVSMLDALRLNQEQIIVGGDISVDRQQINALLKTLSRAGRDIARYRAVAYEGNEPWEFAYRERENPSGGYWSHEHMWGAEWPLGDSGLPTPGSIAAQKALEAERQRIEEEKARLKEQQGSHNSPANPS